MERNIHIDEFEEFLKEKADQYKMYPSDKAWDNIHRSVHPRKKWAYLSLTLLLLLGTAIFVDQHNHYLSGNNRLTFNNNNFKRSDLLIMQGSGLSSSMSASTTNNTQALQLASAPATLLSKGSRYKAKPVVEREDNDDGHYTDDENLEIAAGAKNLVSYNTTARFTGLNAGTDNDDNDDEKKIKKVLWGGETFRKSKFKWQLFFSPTVSYRKLTSGISEITEVFRGVPYSTAEESNSVTNLVTHKPAIGAEAGANLVYKVSDNFSLKAGLQLNYSRYQLRAFPTKPEQATLAVISKPEGADSINVISTLQNFSGSGSSWLNNEYFQISLPVGFEWGVLGNSTLKWNIAASAQPVYNFANNVYLLSTDFSRYGQDPSLIRKWNINAGVETYVSYNMGAFKWQAGPQLRYQLMSSYKSQYPVKEYLVDFGFKIGVTKTLR